MAEHSDYICHPCGIKYGTPRGFFSTYHTSECGWCGERTSVTHCRAYNYPIRPEGLPKPQSQGSQGVLVSGLELGVGDE